MIIQDIMDMLDDR